MSIYNTESCTSRTPAISQILIHCRRAVEIFPTNFFLSPHKTTFPRNTLATCYCTHLQINSPPHTYTQTPSQDFHTSFHTANCSHCIEQELFVVNGAEKIRRCGQPTIPNSNFCSRHHQTVNNLLPQHLQRHVPPSSHAFPCFQPNHISPPLPNARVSSPTQHLPSRPTLLPPRSVRAALPNHPLVTHPSPPQRNALRKSPPPVELLPPR